MVYGLGNSSLVNPELSARMYKDKASRKACIGSVRNMNSALSFTLRGKMHCVLRDRSREGELDWSLAPDHGGPKFVIKDFGKGGQAHHAEKGRRGSSCRILRFSSPGNANPIPLGMAYL